jgi:hypothetical protein
VYNYHDSCAPGQERSGTLPRLVDVMGFWLGSGRMDWFLFWLVMLDMMMSENWRVSSKVSGWLCVSLWSCGCVPTLDRMFPLMN